MGALASRRLTDGTSHFTQTIMWTSVFFCSLPRPLGTNPGYSVFRPLRAATADTGLRECAAEPVRYYETWPTSLSLRHYRMVLTRFGEGLTMPRVSEKLFTNDSSVGHCHES